MFDPALKALEVIVVAAVSSWRPVIDLRRGQFLAMRLEKLTHKKDFKIYKMLKQILFSHLQLIQYTVLSFLGSVQNE